MDVIDFFSSDSEDNHQSQSDGRETISTDTDRKVNDISKTKNIKKHYDPFMENGKLYKYEDNPNEYKKMRKKVQNRESACRVRGRKKHAFDNLEQEVEYLRKKNSELHLQNHKLQFENKILKEHVQYMKGFIPPVNPHLQKKDSIEQYLNPDVLSSGAQSPDAIISEEYESPFMMEEFNFNRLTSEDSSGSVRWFSLAVFTIVLAIFVLPSTESSKVVAAYQIGSQPTTHQIVSIWTNFDQILGYFKLSMKYLLTLLYIWIVFSIGYNFVRRKKLKKV